MSQASAEVPVDARRTIARRSSKFQTGSLSLRSLLRVASSQRARMVVRACRGDEMGHLFIAEGTIHHASIGELTGEAAVLYMLGWEHARLSLTMQPWPPHASVQSEVGVILARAA